jgi:hypothetical protein
MTDREHRREFFAPIVDEVERILAVRAVYLAVREDVTQLPEKGPAGTAAGGLGGSGRTSSAR